MIGTATCADPQTGESAEGSVEGYAEAMGGGHRCPASGLGLVARTEAQDAAGEDLEWSDVSL